MAKYILEQIKVAGELKELITKTDGENVRLSIDGRETTLAEELARILVEIAALPTTTGVAEAVSAAIDGLVGGAPETYNTLKEIADYISEHEDVVTALNAAIGGKVSKEDGKGLSANDFSDVFKTKLESLKTVAASSVNGNILVGGEEVTIYQHPTGEGHNHIPAGGADGQILTKTASGYEFADAPAGVHYGDSAQPEYMKDGEMFVRIVG